MSVFAQLHKHQSVRTLGFQSPRIKTWIWFAHSLRNLELAAILCNAYFKQKAWLLFIWLTHLFNDLSRDLVPSCRPDSLYYLSELFLEWLLPPTSGVWLQEFKIKAAKYRCYLYRTGVLLWKNNPCVIFLHVDCVWMWCVDSLPCAISFHHWKEPTVIYSNSIRHATTCDILRRSNLPFARVQDSFFPSQDEFKSRDNK